MTTPPVPASPFRSLGSKFFLIVLLALGMSLAGLTFNGLTADRASEHGVHLEAGAAPPATVLGLHLTDSYRSTYRALHYLPLFLGLVFLTYFLLEVLTQRQLHPAQYALVGVAQLIFYLLLLSLSEHVGFDLSFLIAGAATVALFAANTDWLFHDRRLAVRALAAFAGLYGFIYVLLRVDAYALLIGALASFAAVALAMRLTRNVEWYSLGTPTLASVPPPPRESWLD